MGERVTVIKELATSVKRQTTDRYDSDKLK